MGYLDTHRIETGWSPDAADTIRAYCTSCKTWFGAWCTASDYHSIRVAEQAARTPFDDYECWDAPI